MLVDWKHLQCVWDDLVSVCVFLVIGFSNSYVTDLLQLINRDMLETFGMCLECLALG